ncbi:hypothetical protein TrRE_jg9350, partial [Triparma retinervis]
SKKYFEEFDHGDEEKERMLEVMANMKKKCAFVSAAYLPPKHAKVAGFVMVNISISAKLTEDAKTNRDLIGNVDDLRQKAQAAAELHDQARSLATLAAFVPAPTPQAAIQNDT